MTDNLARIWSVVWLFFALAGLANGWQREYVAAALIITAVWNAASWLDSQAARRG